MRKKFLQLIFPALVFCLMVTGLTDAHEGAHGAPGKNTIAYTTHIVRVFNAKCASCHGPDSPEHMEFMRDQQKYTAMSKGPRMDTYTYLASFVVWPDTGAIMRRLDDGTNTKNGKPGNMYMHLGSDEAERQANLRIFRDWVGHWTLKRRGEIAKEELEKITMPY